MAHYHAVSILRVIYRVCSAHHLWQVYLIYHRSELVVGEIFITVCVFYVGLCSGWFSLLRYSFRRPGSIIISCLPADDAAIAASIESLLSHVTDPARRQRILDKVTLDHSMKGYPNSYTCLRVMCIVGFLAILLLIQEQDIPSIIEGQSQEPAAFKIKTNESNESNWTDFYDFNSTNPFEYWCSTAICSNSPLCSPCQKRFLFIVGTGRSGSTTLLRMFNELLCDFQGKIMMSFVWLPNFPIICLNHPISTMIMEEEGAFMHNSIPTGSFGCVMQDLLAFMDPPPMSAQTSGHVDEYDTDRLLGMKTIRLHQDWKPWKAAQYFKDNFPCSKVIVNIRSDFKVTVKSMHERGWDITEEDIKYATSFYKKFTEHMGEHAAKLIYLEEWKDDVGVLNDVVDWLGYTGCGLAWVYGLCVC